MKKPLFLMLAASGLLLSACAGTPDCLKHQSYEQARAFPPLKSPPGLKVPQPDPDMQIPQVSNGPIAAYRKAPANTDQNNPESRCLTTPPPLASS